MGKWSSKRYSNRFTYPTASYGLSQIISDPTHYFFQIHLPVLTDLIFTNEPNLVTESGVHPSLHRKCHPQIEFAKLNLKVEYPPLYERLIWDNKNADIPSINRKIKEVYRRNTICKNSYSKSLMLLFIWLIFFSNARSYCFVKTNWHSGFIFFIKNF